jgi:hypothetical protein
MAFVSIRDPDFFDLQSALFASDKILTLMQQVYNGQYPPIAFYTNAWAVTIHHWAEQVRVSKIGMATQ